MNQVRVGVACIVIDGNKVLLGHRTKDKEDTGGIIGRDTWTLPGGKQEFNETIEECAIRETKEECNLDVSNIKVLEGERTHCFHVSYLNYKICKALHFSLTFCLSPVLFRIPLCSSFLLV